MLDDGAVADKLDQVLYDAVQRTFERLWRAFYEAFGYATHVAPPPPGKETGGGREKKQDTAEQAMEKENQKHTEEEGEQEKKKERKDALFERKREREVGEGGESESGGMAGVSDNVQYETLSESVRLLMSALSDLIHIVLAGAH